MPGLIQQKVNPKDWLFGSSPIQNDTVFIKSGDWGEWLPEGELQKTNVFDTWSCVSQSACNVIETYLNYMLAQGGISAVKTEWLKEKGYLVDGKFNFSDRYVARISNTKVGYGNTYNSVGEAIRVHGLVPESMWSTSMDMNESEYYSDVSEVTQATGRDFIDKFPINYELVHLEDFKEALQYAPLQIGVNAWYKNNQGVYYNTVDKHNHAVEDYKEHHIFDSYKPYLKTLVEDYNYGFWAGKYYVNLNKYMKKLELKQNTLVQLTEGHGGFGLYLDDRIIVDDLAKIQASWILRNSKEGKFNEGFTRSLTQEQWDSFPKANLKGETL